MPTVIKIICNTCALILMWNTVIFAQHPHSDDELGLRVHNSQASLDYFDRNKHAAALMSPLRRDSAAEALRRTPIPFSVLFKYDTSWHNPAHRCYEIIKPITPTVLLRFNFMSLSQYTVGGSR